MIKIIYYYRCLLDFNYNMVYIYYVSICESVRFFAHSLTIGGFL